ncbi:hypothetical protein K438DRAFT_1971317 [Mycena galopus ATCC 62051]|nr:hypothetical protein K438DRAFT_1971317 [Mycena galopus ATCC 62051]
MRIRPSFPIPSTHPRPHVRSPPLDFLPSFSNSASSAVPRNPYANPAHAILTPVEPPSLAQRSESISACTSAPTTSSPPRWILGSRIVIVIAIIHGIVVYLSLVRAHRSARV